MGRLELEAVTVDAYGTLVELDAPVRRLREALALRGVERDDAAVAEAFAAEVAYYSKHRLDGGDPDGLADLRARCARVFVEASGCELDFTADFQDAIRFVPLPGVPEALARLRRARIPVAVVSNWDSGLREHLERLDLAQLVDEIVVSAEVGVAKPDPAVFRLALERLGARPERSLHVGDDAADEEGARAAGMQFAPAPLPDAVAAL